MTVVGYTALIYDYFLTVADEIRYVWKAEKTLVTVLFLVNRYVTFVVLAVDMYDKGGTVSYISDRFCFSWYFVEGAWYVTSFGIIHALVAMRIVFTALISRAGEPFWIHVGINLTHASELRYDTIRTYSSAMFSLDYTISVSTGGPIRYLPLMLLSWACWVPPLTLEAVLFVLSCIQASKAGRYTSRTPLLRILVRDGTFHFLVIVCKWWNSIKHTTR
ncbi:hypothetical protein FRC10_009945 [Ceratobasidium sp. 414]|nr:hypothetical protein FRC10_009945 [Ceratobasidium sp. 414]